MAVSAEYPDLPFVRPKSWTAGRKPGCPKLIVIHYTAGHEGPNDAENGAAYDQTRTDGTSAHYYEDSNSVVQCVYTWDEAHTARSHGNDLGIQHELCGTNQTREQWFDDVSDATLTNAARQAARDAVKYGILVRRLSVAEVRAAHPDFGNKPNKGFCGHNDITRAFPEDNGTHLDPGDAFPWDIFLARVRDFLDGDDMDLTDLVKLPADKFPEIGGQKSDSVENCLGWGLARSLRIELQSKQALDLLAALAKQMGVAQEDIDDIQARVGTVVTFTDEQFEKLRSDLGIDPAQWEAAARRAIRAQLDDDPAT